MGGEAEGMTSHHRGVASAHEKLGVPGRVCACARAWRLSGLFPPP